MKVFISYSRHDEGAVRSMVGALQRARVQVWLDEDLGGGDVWWTEIINQIRGCSVFLFALSDHSLNSKPCRAEIDYATALSLPILPVQIGTVTSFRTDPLFSKQLVDYRTPDMTTGMALMAALHERAAQPRELPNPLPDPPPIPYEYLLRLGAAIRNNADLDRSAQVATVFELRTALGDEDDDGVRADIRELLQLLRTRRDVVYTVVREIDAVLGGQVASGEETTQEPELTTKRHDVDDLPNESRVDEQISAEKAPRSDALVENKPQADPTTTTEPRGYAEASGISTAYGAPTAPAVELPWEYRPNVLVPTHIPAQVPLVQRLNRRVIIAAAALVIAVAVGGALLYVFVFTHESASPADQIRALERESDYAYNRGDAAALNSYMCKNSSFTLVTSDDLRKQLDENGTVTTSVDNIVVTGDQATANLTYHYSKSTQLNDTEQEKFAREGQDWKDCGLANPPPGTSTPPTP